MKTRLGRKLVDILPERSTLGACRGKVLYPGHDEAHRMGRFLRRQGIRGLTAYRCKACKAWHLGRNPSKNTKDA